MSDSNAMNGADDTGAGAGNTSNNPKDEKSESIDELFNITEITKKNQTIHPSHNNTQNSTNTIENPNNAMNLSMSPSISASTFDELEHEFSHILHELISDKSLQRFKNEYEKLYTVLKKSHENERLLIKKCRDLHNEILSNANKIQTALKLSTADTHTIQVLKQEITNAWQLITKNEEKELYHQVTIQRLKDEIQNLSRLIEQGAGLSVGQENTVNTLLQQQHELQQQIVVLNTTIEEKNQKYKILEEENHQLKSKYHDLDTSYHELTQKHQILENENLREKKKNERYAQELQNMKELTHEYKQEIGNYKSMNQRLNERQHEVDVKYNNVVLMNDKNKHIVEEYKVKLEDYETELQIKINIEKNLIQDRNDVIEQLNMYKRELNIKHHEVLNYTKRYEKLEKQYNEEHQLRTDAEKYRTYLKEQLKVLIKNLEIQKKQCDVDERTIQLCNKQISTLEMQLQGIQEKLEIQERLSSEIEYIKKEKSLVDKQHVEESQRLHTQLQYVNKQNTLNVSKQHELQERYQEVVKQNSVQQECLSEYKHLILEEKKKYNVQFTLYESLRVEKNHLNKLYLSKEDEYTELYRKYKILVHQNDQLKIEVASKDEQLVNEHFAYKRIHEECKLLKRKIQKRKQIIEKCDTLLESQNREILTLRKTLVEIEILSKNQKSVYDAVVKERDLLGTQLIVRNDELQLLEEKLKIYAITLENGEVAYRQRLHDIKELKKLNQQLNRSLALSQSELIHIDALKSEVYTTQRQLLVERTKVKALSDELETPLNVHRWRLLEASDPSKYELLQKIQVLQKRLIQKTEEVVGSYVSMNEKQQTIDELKNMLKRLPGNEAIEQISRMQNALREKTRQLKSMAAELNVRDLERDEQIYMVEKVEKEKEGWRRQALELRKQTMQNKQSASGIDEEKEQQRFSRTTNSMNSSTSSLSQSQTQNIAKEHQNYLPSQQPAKSIVLGGGFGMTAIKVLKSPKHDSTEKHDRKNSNAVAIHSNSIAGSASASNDKENINDNIKGHQLLQIEQM